MKCAWVVALLASGCMLNTSSTTSSTGPSGTGQNAPDDRPVPPRDSTRYTVTTWAEYAGRAPSAAPPSSTPATCDAAHDHCLRGVGWFIDSGEGTPVLVQDGKLVSYAGKSPMEWPNRFFVTVPAVQAPERLVEGRMAVCFLGPGLPASEADAATSTNWRLRGVDSIDPAAGIVVMDGDPIPMANMRVLVELVDLN